MLVVGFSGGLVKWRDQPSEHEKVIPHLNHPAFSFANNQDSPSQHSFHLLLNVLILMLTCNAWNSTPKLGDLGYNHLAEINRLAERLPI